jgi:hypothetical protein
MVAILGLDAARRAWRGRSGAGSDRLEAAVLITLVITSAGGLGMLIGGARPTEPLHVLYAILALGSLPLARSFSRRTDPRRSALIMLGAVAVAIVLIVRLFQTS